MGGRCAYQEAAADDIAAIVPDDVRTVLDVGCGDGFVSRRLADRCRVTGLDLSGDAVRKAAGNRLRGDVTRLPVEDQAFDLVMINDVLEHLDDDAQRLAVTELQRTAAKYLIVTVPLQEQLMLGAVCCADCGDYYHVNYHLRSYGLGDVAALFEHPQWSLRLQILSGDVWRDYPPEVLMLRRLFLLDPAPSEALLCRNCGSHAARRARPNETVAAALDCLSRDACVDDPSVADLTMRRTECVTLFAKGPAESGSPQRGFLDAHRTSVTVDKLLLSNATLDLRRPALHRRSFFTPFSHLPYFLGGREVSQGVEIGGEHPLWVAFSLCERDTRQVELECSGVAAGSSQLRLWSFHQVCGYHSPVTLRVNGRFRTKVRLPAAELSRYGLVFQIDATGAPIVMETLRLENVKGQERVVYQNPEGRARFMALPGPRTVLLSLPVYGEYILELGWMRNPQALASSRQERGWVGCSPDSSVAMHAFTQRLKEECDRREEETSELSARCQRLLAASRRTIVGRLNVVLSRIKCLTASSDGRA